MVNNPLSCLRHIMGLGLSIDELAELNATGGVVIEAKVPKDSIIYTNSRDESEVIINFTMDIDHFSIIETIGNSEAQ